MQVKFNNKKQVSGWGLFLTLLALVAMGMLGSYYLFVDNRIQSIELSLWAFFIVIALLYTYGGFAYLDVDLTEEKVDVKFYKLIPIGRAYKRIMLPVNKIQSIKVANGIGVIGRRLVVTGRLKGRTALFPSVGLAACNKEQVEQLRKYTELLDKK